MTNLPPEVIEAQLDEYRRQFESGFRDALMHALLFCGRERVVMPEWLVVELVRGWQRFVRRDAENLGEAFGITWPKGSHKAAYRKKRRLKLKVWLRVRELHKQGVAIDDAMFARVGKELGLGKTLASDYYYEAERNKPLPVAAQMLLEPYKKKP